MGTVGWCELPPLVTSSCPEMVSPCPHTQAPAAPIRAGEPPLPVLPRPLPFPVCVSLQGRHPKSKHQPPQKDRKFFPGEHVRRGVNKKSVPVGMFQKTQVLHLGAGSSAPAWQRQALGCRGVGAPDVHGAVLSNRTRGTVTLG